MDLRISKLIVAFEQAGWKSHGSVDIKSDWWFENIILLVYEWRPVDVSLYLTFLTDPQITDKKVVWAVSFSSSFPEQNNMKSIKLLSLNDIEKINLAEFVKEINSGALSEKIKLINGRK